MKYVSPLTTIKSTTVNGQTYDVEYFKPPVSLTGVTDEVISEYAPASTYAFGAWVKLDAIKKKFRAAIAIAANEHPLEYPEKWIDYGPLNSYRMLATDSFINGRTSGADMVIELDFSRCTTVAFVAADFVSVRIELIDTYGGGSVTLFDETYAGRDISCVDFAEYYYTDYKAKSRLVIDGLDWSPSSTLRLTFSGAVEIGALVYGVSSDIGITLLGTSLTFQDKSTITNSVITGVRSVTRYGSIRVVEARVAIASDTFNVVANKIEAIIGRNILWLPTAVEQFIETISIGYIEEIRLPIDGMNNPVTDTTIIGVL